MRDLVRECEEMCEDSLRDGLRTVGRYVCHGDIPRACRFEIDHIETRGDDTQVLQLWEGREDLLGHEDLADQ